MKLAIVGSRSLKVPFAVFDRLVPGDVSEIVSGGAAGVDRCAAEYARARGIALKEFYPDYDTHANRAPIIRNIELVDYSDSVMVFWDGNSNGSAFVIKYARKKGKPCSVFGPAKGSNTD